MADWKPATLLEALVVQKEFVRETHKMYVLLLIYCHKREAFNKDVFPYFFFILPNMQYNSWHCIESTCIRDYS
jgi:hypothetical protein